MAHAVDDCIVLYETKSRMAQESCRCEADTPSDVLVAGGGPAGAVSALCLARLGWRVILLEAGTDETAGYGETLPPESNPLLRSLGLWDAFQRSAPLESPGIVSRWGQSLPSQQDFLCNPYGSGWHVDRARFDAELRAEASRAGVTVLRGARVKTLVRRGGCWLWNGIRARFVVDATGRNGLRLDAAAAREIEDTLLALVLRIAHPGGRPADLRTQIVAVESGWWYWSPVPDGSSVAMFFTCLAEYRRARLLAPARCARAAPVIGALVNSGPILEARWISVSSSLRKSLYGDAWVAVGDSASSYDPLSGRGIFKAIRHASLAAQALDVSLRGGPDAFAGYEARVRGEYRDYRKQRKAYYALEQRWPSSSFWAGRHK